MSSNSKKRKCAYCGKLIKKPSTVSKPDWQRKRIVFCSKKHFSLSRRVDAMSYMGRSLLIEGIGVREFWRELRRWYDCSLNIVVEANHGGIKPILNDRRAEEVIRAMGVAFLEFSPNMVLGPDMKWDYRMILQQSGQNVFWTKKRGRTQLRKALRIADIKKQRFVDILKETLADCKSANIDQLEGLDKASRKLRNSLTDYDIPLLYGETQWVQAIHYLLKYDEMKAETAFYMATVIDYLRSKSIDYRMLLPSMKPSDFVRLKIDWKKRNHKKQD